MPERIQLRRTAGWRKPDGAVVVSRPTRWGNPWTVVNGHRQGWLVYDDRDRLGLAPAATTSEGFIASYPSREEAARNAVKRYRKWLTSSQARVMDLVPILRGHDLCCWCPLLDRQGNLFPCHANVLLELANASS